MGWGGPISTHIRLIPTQSPHSGWGRLERDGTDSSAAERAQRDDIYNWYDQHDYDRISKDGHHNRIIHWLSYKILRACCIQHLHILISSNIRISPFMLEGFLSSFKILIWWSSLRSTVTNLARVVSMNLGALSACLAAVVCLLYVHLEALLEMGFGVCS
ncbi:hypothetical protein PIB30_013872 [Stylosanthes scabra]|uniref:Uncharacterized protein n=1 Tax=Stylosanthes scabra TaxID=79078 RepID=A0ABU6U7F9_9FABA|nr:hypothetical protein [Stylosanthes scabra]